MKRKTQNLNYSSKRVARLQKQRLVRNVLIWVCMIFTLLFLYLVFFSPAFLLINVSIKNTKEIPNDIFLARVKQRILDNNNKLYWGFVSIFSKNPNILANMFLINNQDLISELKIDFPQINTINISKNYFTRSLEVEIEEKHPVLIAKIFEEEFSNIYLDQNGVLFKASTVDEKLLPKIFFLNFPGDWKINLNEQVIEKQIFSKEQMENLLMLLNYLKETKNINFVLEFDFNKQNSVNLKMNLFDIYLSLNGKIVDAFKAANLYFSKIIKSKNISIEYIDVRYYPEKLFYK